MAVAAKAWGAEVGNTNTTLVVPTPSGWASGDALIVALCCQNAAATDWDAITTGWTRIGPAYVANDSNARTTGLYIRFPTSTPATTFTFTNPSTGARITGRMGLFSGMDSNNPVSGTTTWFKGGASATSYTLLGSGAVGSAYNLMEFTGQFASPNSYAITSNSASAWLTGVADAASPSGAENTTVSRTVIHLLAGTAPATVPDITLTTATSGARSIFMVSLAPAVVPVTGSGSLGGTGTVSGSGSIPAGNNASLSGTGTLTATTAPKPIVTAALTGTGTLSAWPAGYASVTEMLAQSTFYCAHRGGSYSYPEMSMYAYQSAAAAGYGALELSLARTSDGVWFGLHDASLDRTSLNSGGGAGTTLVAANMTWAQVQQYKILGSMAGGNPTQADQPYMRLDDFLARFYPTHVVFIDPKNAYAYRSELLDILDTLPGNPRTHFVGKFFGVDGGTGNTGWAHDCAARGYKTWGYFYETNQTDFAVYVPRWDILGMDYGASQSSWDALLAAGPGKPVMPHIMASQTDVNTGLAKLAQAVTDSGTTPAGRGVMVSGAATVVPAPPAHLFTSGVSLSGTGTLGAGGSPATSGSGSLSGTGSLSATGKPTGIAAPALTGTGSLSASSAAVGSSSASLTGMGVLAVAASPLIVVAPALTGSGLLTATPGTVTQQFAAALAGRGDLTATSTATLVDVAVLAGVGTLTAVGVPGAAPRDITLTVTVGARRWTATAGPRRWTGGVA